MGVNISDRYDLVVDLTMTQILVGDINLNSQHQKGVLTMTIKTPPERILLDEAVKIAQKCLEDFDSRIEVLPLQEPAGVTRKIATRTVDRVRCLLQGADFHIGRQKEQLLKELLQQRKEPTAERDQSISELISKLNSKGALL